MYPIFRNMWVSVGHGIKHYIYLQAASVEAIGFESLKNCFLNLKKKNRTSL
jgi:hypothetical protein